MFGNAENIFANLIKIISKPVIDEFKKKRKKGFKRFRFCCCC